MILMVLIVVVVVVLYMVECDNRIFVIQDKFPLRNETLLLKEDTIPFSNQIFIKRL